MAASLMSRASPDAGTDPAAGAEAGAEVEAYVARVLAEAPTMTPAVRHRLTTVVHDPPDALAS
jgi:hypothetical protein